MGQSINLFMWGYQPHFRINLDRKAKDLYEALSLHGEIQSLLIGVRTIQGAELDCHEACIEPENGPWPVSILKGLPQKVHEIEKNHPLHNMMYGDEASMLSKPERIRKDSVRQAIENILTQHDTGKQFTYFCGIAVIVDYYYVVPVLEVPNVLLKSVPSLSKKSDSSFLHSIMRVLIEEACQDLSKPNPGKDLRDSMRSTEEILKISARRFVDVVHSEIDKQFFMYRNLFDSINVISSLMYEGDRFKGSKLLICNKDDPKLEYSLKFQVPVPIRDSRWSRKILQMASTEVNIISDGKDLLGLGSVRPTELDESFTVDFYDFYHWQLFQGKNPLIKCGYGMPLSPSTALDKIVFIENYLRIFRNATEANAVHIWNIIEIASQLDHGSMVVISTDSEIESERLQNQGTRIAPQFLTPELFKNVSKIDGTILVDQKGICHSIGVILDGPADPECTPSRGSRYNSGVRYVKANMGNRLVIVASEDKTIDVLPLGPKKLSRKILEYNINKLEKSNNENFFRFRNWLDEHRFYLNQTQCDRINTALARLKSQPRDGGIFFELPTFTAYPDYDDSYLKD